MSFKQTQQGELECPFPTCHEPMLVVWEKSRALSFDDIGEMNSDTAYCQTWEIKCCAGHVISIPGDIGCEEHRDTDCNCGGFDWDEDFREIKDHDIEAFRAIYDRISSE